jgi:hypothetical protein
MMLTTFPLATKIYATMSNSNSRRTKQEASPILMDRLVWIRRPRPNSNHNNHDNASTNDIAVDDSANYVWWPAVYCDSHMQAWNDFSSRMTPSLKVQASLQILKEQSDAGTDIPVAVAVMGPLSSVVSLQAAVDNDNSDNNNNQRIRICTPRLFGSVLLDEFFRAVPG